MLRNEPITASLTLESTDLFSYLCVLWSCAILFKYCSILLLSDMSSLLEPAKPPPRLFCDICDVFDEHDTDDCPIQAQDDEGPPPSHYHEERQTVRAYCETCEGKRRHHVMIFLFTVD